MAMGVSYETPESLLLDRESRESASGFADKVLDTLEGGDRDLFLSILSGASDEEISEVTGRTLASQQKVRKNLLDRLKRLFAE
jgi:hypothetical protein